MNLRKLFALAAALLLAVLPAALAGAPAGINARQETDRNVAAFSTESYDTVWVTPVFDDYIINGLNPEKYPARFVSFPVPEGAKLVDYRYDSSLLVDVDAMVSYFYGAYDRYSFEVFLEKQPEENILSDGSDGPAVYVDPERRIGAALIDLKPHFEGTPKLEVTVRSYDRSVTKEQLQGLIRAELERVQAAMKVQDTEGFWSKGRYNSIEIRSTRDAAYGAVVDVGGQSVTGFDDHHLVTKWAEDTKMTYATEIAIDSYSYPHQKAGEGNANAAEAAMKDGTPYMRYLSDTTGYATFTLLEKEGSDAIYLSVKISAPEGSFDEALETLWSKISVSKPE